MSNLNDKARVLANGLTIIQSQFSKERYLAWCEYMRFYKETGLIDNTKIKELDELNEQFKLYYGDDWKVAQQVNNNRFRRTLTLKKRTLKAILSNNAYFYTLTFTDNVLSATSEKTRRKYVQLFCASQSDFYVANIDYGKEHGREHYHVIMIGRVNFKDWRKYGSINGKPIRANVKDNVKIASYMTKLTNHAIKTTTKQQKLLYSRKKCYNLDAH